MRAHDEEFRAFVHARSGRLFGAALLLTGSRSEAEELLQASLAKTFVAWPRIRHHGAADAYVRRTMVNTRTNAWKRRSRETLTDLVPEQAVPDHAPQVVNREAVLGALRTLPRRQRAAVVLRYYEQLTEAEAAEVLGTSVGTIKSATSRGLARLREQLGNDPDHSSTLHIGGQR